MSADLFEDHRKIVAAADELLATFRRRPDLPIEQLNMMRVRIGSLSMAHLRAEEEQIIGPLTARGLVAEIPGAAAALTAIRAGRGAYSDHIRKWTPQAIERDRSGYIGSLTGMIALLKRLTAQEEAELYVPALKLLAPERRVGNG